jgi:periplasmic protein TonB
MLCALSGSMASADPPTIPADNASGIAPGPVQSSPPLLHCPGPSQSESAAARKKLKRYYPERAMRAVLPGKAIIDCLVQTGGTLGDCKLVSETPPGYGFGEKALEMTTLYKMKGEGGECKRVQIPVDFKMPN